MVEGPLEDRGLVHVEDVDDDMGPVFGGGARVAEVDGGVRGLDGEAVMLDTFKVQGLCEGKVWWAPALSQGDGTRPSQQPCEVVLR